MSSNDPDLVMKDFYAYVQAWEELTAAYSDKPSWCKTCVHNTAESGYFSSDRTIREYANEIWHV
jgi:starch phosphorylase